VAEVETESSEHEERLFRPPAATYRLTRWVLLRLLGIVYGVAFLALADQVVPLLGERGLLPARDFLAQRALDGEGWLSRPTLFWIDASDRALLGWAWLGALLALAVVVGATNALIMAALWAIHLSFVQVGQVFLGYGWELLLAEAGFLAIFLCPIRDIRPFPGRHDPSPIVMVLYRWLLLRVMLGAGLIKVRGDPCWTDLSCLEFHYETQPLPSPLSPLWHALPRPVLHAGVVFNHLVELIAPLFLLAHRPFRLPAALLTIVFQFFLIASGNLSYLNWLTIAIAVACFDDAALERVLPARLVHRARMRPSIPSGRIARAVPVVLAIGVGVLSVNPVVNLLSPDQRMNASFDPFRLVNTYGAFGVVNRVRRELVIEGTRDPDPAQARWQAYVLPCQPGPLERRPCFVAPWPLRLDWQMWFAAMSTPEQEPWLIHLVWQLLRGDRDLLNLFAHAPFSPDAPPRWIRIRRYRYRFARAGEPGWWVRDREEEWMRPVSLDDPALRADVEAFGWTD